VRLPPSALVSYLVNNGLHAQDILEPYLVRDLHFHGATPKLQLLCQAISSSPRVANMISRSIRGVYVDAPPGAGPTYLSDVLVLLGAVRHLDALVCRALDVTESLIPLVSAASQPAPGGAYMLQKLDVQMQVGWASLLRQLGQFTALRELHLSLYADEVRDPPPGDGHIPLLPAWSMSSLHSFSWESDIPDDELNDSAERHRDFFDLLARSSFPALRAVKLALFPLTHGTADAAGRFFTGHPTIERTELVAERWGICNLVPRITCPQLVIETSQRNRAIEHAPVGDVIGNLRPSVREIVFLSYPGDDDLDMFLDAINDLALNAHRPDGLHRVIVRFQPGDGRSPHAVRERDIRVLLTQTAQQWAPSGIELRNELHLLANGAARVEAEL
jgi:hypothetical protein